VNEQFDRLRRRTAQRRPGVPTPVDVDGKRALFSTDAPVPPRGTVEVECSACRAVSVLSMTRGARLVASSVYVPLRRSRHRSLVRCPACRRIAWARLRLRRP
jgi:hypothetical protein